MWRNEDPSTLLVGMQNVANTMEHNMELFQKIKNKLPEGLALLLLDIYPNELKAGSHRGICLPVFITDLFTIAKQAPYMPSVGEWINEMWYIQTMEYY